MFYKNQIVHDVEEIHLHHKPWVPFAEKITENDYLSSIVPYDPQFIHNILAQAEQGFGPSTWTSDNINLPSEQIADVANPVFTSEEEIVYSNNVTAVSTMPIPVTSSGVSPIPTVKKTDPKAPIVNAVMSPWSDWSVCQPWLTRTRTRSCIRQGRNGGIMCGPTIDELPCI